MNDRSLQATLTDIFARAIAQATQQPAEQVDPAVRAAGDPKFGDYQCNAAMGLARALGAKPRDVAERIRAAAEPLLADVAEPLEIAGPGFINIRLREGYLAGRLGAIQPGEAPADAVAPVAASDATGAASAAARFAALLRDRMGIRAVATPETVVADYSSPNLAKQMHVGHLRSTIIGDALARVLTFAGHTVIRQNHVGDWGTQFGMIVHGLWLYHCLVEIEREPADWFQSERARLTEAKDEGLREYLSALARRIEKHYRADVEGRAWFEWVTQLSVAGQVDALVKERLEPVYQFINDVEARAAGHPDVGLEDVRRGKFIPLARMSNHVVAMLQDVADPRNRPEAAIWRQVCESSIRNNQAVYDRLGVLLSGADVRGESFYQIGLEFDPAADRLAPTIAALRAALPPRPDAAAQLQPWAECRDDQGAVCVFFWKPGGEPLFKNPEGAPLPLIVRKSDGAYLYASTDLAAIRFRVNELHATRILYVVGAPTKLHLDMLFACARLAGWAPPPVRLEHVSFGQVLGEDRKLLRTRAGNAVKLAELLDEAERRAYALLVEREQAAGAEAAGVDGPVAAGALAGRPEAAPLTEAEKREVARRVGIASVKYFDLARERNADYVFNFDQMLAMQGNTAPYMLYAYARIRSIYRKAAERFGAPDVYAASVRLRLEQPTERVLALRLVRLAEVVDVVARDLTPHVLCTYLYELAAEFMRFYEACPVLAAADEATRLSRMRLCDLTARTLRLGLGLLGIEVIERM